MFAQYTQRCILKIKPWLLSLMLLLPLACLPITSYAEISKAEASAKAKSQHGGKVLSVKKTGSKEGKSYYKVKLLLPDGRVKTVTISG